MTRGIRPTRGDLAFAAALTAGAALAAAQPLPTTWSFEADAAGAPPAGFHFERTGGGPPGRWVVRAEGDAPTGRNVLAQTDADRTDDRFPVAVADEPSVQDLALSVKCKPVSGHVDQACGLVFRYRDANNYYLTRANALEGNVRFYFVKDGRRKQLASWSGEVRSGVWHSLRVEARGDHFEIDWDGTRVIDSRDETFSDAGKVGLWTKADSVTYFDDLSVARLP
jgi:hypothetical protein